VLRFGLIFLLGLAVVAWALWASHRRPIAVAAASIAAGAGVALFASLLVDCRMCQTGALAVGTLMSLPFFVVGWIALAVPLHEEFHRSWLLPVLAASSFQVFWALPLTHAATIRGECPCMGLIFNGVPTALTAIGMDRAVGPVLLAEAVISVWLIWRAFVRATPRIVQPDPR
jgi:hypothetical protein